MPQVPSYDPDNIFIAQKWMGEKMNMEKETLQSYFGIPEDLDYIE